MLHLTDGQPVTPCCGCWPIARTPHTPGWLRRRFVTTVAELDLLLTLPWVHLSCPSCHDRIEI